MSASSYICPVCRESVSADEIEEDHHTSSARTANLHGYELIGYSTVRRSSILRVCIPEKVQKTSSDGSIYAPYQFVNLLRLLQNVVEKLTWTLGPEVEKARVISAMRQWVERICLDEEAHSIYLAIYDSVIPDENFEIEVVERVAEIFDLPRFWVRA